MPQFKKKLRVKSAIILKKGKKEFLHLSVCFSKLDCFILFLVLNFLKIQR
ncbi:hypothetical protein LEP1GSC188_0867 [Leptospira weilii serovar Topaz str. LT2116]|uniref:Uncharacterized protein n=1 Tax=Leptospira weilii serovar Topaz str. LT2116 TaxID=1088540 RepID=M3ELD0_9LEPT|nr:hypothetical protein LEP1GSC188_0867 [Leptospira weilii serovar Topaz str. LT2116]